MDSLSNQGSLSFLYANLTNEGSALVEPWEVYLRIVADFQVLVGGRTLYSESLFPVVEFAIQSAAWSSRVVQGGPDFVYTSMEADEEGLVWIKPAGERWQIGSVFQEKVDPLPPLELFEVQLAVDDFYAGLRRDVLALFQVDISGLFSWKGIGIPSRLEQ